MINLSSNSLFSGVAIKVFLDYIVKSPRFPWLQGTEKEKILAVAAGFSAIAGLLTCWASGSFDHASVQSLFDALGNMIVVFGTAVGTHEATKTRELPSS